MHKHYDAIVVGVGGMGSAALYHMARRGHCVLGLERYGIPNTMGSSHGTTRIIRLAYFTAPFYLPLLRRAYALWHQLEHDSGDHILHTVGSIYAGPPGSMVFEGTVASCRDNGLEHEVLDPIELKRRYPAYHLPEEMLAVLQPDGGYLLSEIAIEAHTRLAREHGAEIRANVQVLDWEAKGDGVHVRTADGEFDAKRLIITAGAWASRLVPELAPVLAPERQVSMWFETRRPELFAPDRFPVFIITGDDTRYYGFPIVGQPGIKIGKYNHLHEQVDPDTMDREWHARDEQKLRDFVARVFPDANGRVLAATTCMFTNTPDADFVLDLHPHHPQVSIAAGFSGHGYKFCSVIGEVMADLAESGSTAHDISMFRLKRFADRATI